VRHRGRGYGAGHRAALPQDIVIPTASPQPIVIPIRSDADILAAREQGRAMASRMGFDFTNTVLVATVISELARNIVQYAQAGEISFAEHRRGERRGIQIVAADRGPGIIDVDRALQDGYSTSGGLGLGLPGSRRVMDEFELESVPAQGTTVRATKWLR
jgi:serine/threonine-protein kinase RsbT